MKLLIVLGSGGHTKEMLRLVDQLGTDFQYAYLVCADEELSESKIRVPGRVFPVMRPRWQKTPWPLILVRMCIATVQSVVALLCVRPRAIISTGPGVAVPACVLGKLLGVKIIYIETGSRVFALSTSGKILCRFADLFFVQWPELQSQCPKAIYAGRLF